jgi:large subunit ribosomal protein L28
LFGWYRKVIQNYPIPVSYPNEMHQGIWGGEGTVEGLVKKAKYRSPVPRFWVPNLVKTVVHSEVLDKYLSVVVTERTLELIDEHTGLDSYLLKVRVIIVYLCMGNRCGKKKWSS